MRDTASAVRAERLSPRADAGAALHVTDAAEDEGARPGTLRAFAALAAAYWTVLALLLTMQAVLGAARMPWGQAALTVAVDCGSWAVVMAAVTWLAARYPLRPRSIAPVAGAMLVLVLGRWLVLNEAVALIVYGVLWDVRVLLPVLPGNLVWTTAMFLAAHAAMTAHRRVRREQHAGELRARVSQAELGALRAQLRPEALFRAFDAVEARMHGDPAGAERMLVDLGDELRRSLSPGARPPARLATPPAAGPAEAPPAPARNSGGPGVFRRWLAAYAGWYAAFWAVVAGLQVAGQLMVNGLQGPPAPLGEVARRTAAMHLPAPLLFLPALWFASRFPVTHPRRAARAGANAVVLLAGMAVYAGMLSWSHPASPGYGAALLMILPWSFTILCAALAVGHLAAHVEGIRRTELHEARLRAQLSEAELRMLQMQMQPHFLFNTLHSVSALVGRDPDAATRVLEELRGLLRLSLQRASRPLVTLGEELEFARLYLSIEQTRFQDRLRVRMEVPDAVLDAPVPHMILQPLVENAVRHGVSPSHLPCTLEVRAWRQADGALHIAVTDTGVGLPPGWSETRAPGIGIAATRARLWQLYGPDARLSIEPNPPGGTRVLVALPADR